MAEQEAAGASFQPLRGITILAIENIVAMPSATSILASLGATVIKVEPLKSGEAGRVSIPVIRGTADAPFGASLVRYGAGKQSLSINLKDPEGRRILENLVSVVDVLVQNLRGGAADALGLTEARLRELNPSLVYASISGYGRNPASEYESRPAFASVAEGMAGFYESFAGAEGNRPSVGMYGAIVDIVAGLNVVIGILAALIGRSAGDRGQVVDVALLDAALTLNDAVLQSAALGASLDSGRPSGAGVAELFRASDGEFLVMAMRQEQLHALFAVVGRPDLAVDERFAKRSKWSQYVPDVIRPAVEAWAGSLTKREAVTRLSEARVPAAPSLTPYEVLEDEHVRARGMLRRVGGPIPETVVVGNALGLGGAGPQVPSVPRLGQHTRSVLVDLLKMSPDEIDQLVAAGVVEDDPYHEVANP